MAIPPLLIGLAVVGFGTSTPELLVSVDAAWRGVPDIALGNIVGSNIANILLIIGLSALVWPIKVMGATPRRDTAVMMAAALVLVPMFAMGQMGRPARLTLVAGLVAYLVWAYRQPGEAVAEEVGVGMRRSHLDWRMLPLDKRSVRAACRLVGEELARLRMARMRIDDWVMDDGPDWRNVTGRYHHIGTTRMSANARQGVVDRNCRVHGIANLYVSGSSVFTTSGYANSTLTIVALAARLAEHLKQQTL